MNSKILNHIKKITVVFMIVILCLTSTASTVSAAWWDDLVNKIKNIVKFDDINIDTTYFTELKEKFEEMLITGDFSYEKIIEAIMSIIPAGENQDFLLFAVDAYAGNRASMLGLSLDDLDLNLDLDLSGLLKTLIKLLSSLIGGVMGLIGGELEADITDTITIDAATAKQFTNDDKYNVTLSANVYRHNNDQGKWAVVVHPFMLNGKIMANSVGKMYYEQGFNVIAPDLRGFGSSDGSVALGFLESLDVYDWLVELDKKYEPKEVIVHGVSLGAATTNFLSGIDEFLQNEKAPVKMTGIKSLKDDLHVIGLVEDCGYVKMEDFAGKDMILGLGIGLTDNNFWYYGDASYSLQHCDIPIMIIHGDADTMVDPDNADNIEKIVKDNGGDAEKHIIKGGAHAAILMGNNDDYKDWVTDFIKKCEETITVTVTEEAQTTDAAPEDDEKTQSPWGDWEMPSWWNFGMSRFTNALRAFSK